MIRVDRERISPSRAWLDSAQVEREAAREAIAAGDEPVFRVFALPETRELLQQLFHDKCAFCETRVGVVAPADVEHFRPKDRAIGLDGTVALGYWWLAAEWTNLHLSCHLCNRNKGNRFPVAGPRASGPGDHADEVALLLDPCTDDPERTLVFDHDGRVASIGSDPGTLGRHGGHDVGQITIDVFGLNRLDLVERRRALIIRLRAEFASAAGAPAGHLLSPSPDEEYVAVRRQLAGEFRGEFDEGGRSPDADASRRAAFERLEQHESVVKSSSVDDPDSDVIFSQAATLTRVEIENFRCIEHLAFEFPPGAPNRIGWKLLLGENGMGKSSALQAVALTLAGQERAGTVQLDPASLVREGANSGRVRVYLSTDREPLEMEDSHTTA